MDVDWFVAMKPEKRRLLLPGGLEEWAEKAKASVRAKVEHPFWTVKGIFHYGKVRYQGTVSGSGQEPRKTGDNAGNNQPDAVGKTPDSITQGHNPGGSAPGRGSKPEKRG